MQWEYFDRMVVFSESEEGMVSGLDSWINGAGADGWELVSSVPLIAPTRMASLMEPSASTWCLSGHTNRPQKCESVYV